MLTPSPRPGVLASLDRFEILQLLRKGGMGYVFLARDPRPQRLVAIKMVRLELLEQPKVLHRFAVEARRLQKLDHPHILKVLEVSERSEGPYFVMPYMERGSLARLLKQGVPLPTDSTLRIALQLADALRHAHEKGLTHRDIKPANILLDADGNVLLADFGLARSVIYDSFLNLEQAQREGTIPYMSPAIVTGHAEDTRCDIYAFGVVLYEMLTGHLPYDADSVAALCRLMQEGPPKPVRERNPDAPAGLAVICEGAMARDQHDRYANMADVLAELKRVQEGLLPVGPPRGSELLAREARRRLWLRWSALAIAAALCILAGVGYLRYIAEPSEKELLRNRQSVLQQPAPKGKLLFFSRQRATELWTLCAVNPDGSEPLCLLKGLQGPLASSWILPENRSPEIVLPFFDSGSHDFWKIQPDGILKSIPEQEHGRNGAQSLFVRPDGLELALLRYGGGFYRMCLASADGSEPRSRLLSKFPAENWVGQADWLPDGSAVLVILSAPELNCTNKVYCVPTNGSPRSVFLDPALVNMDCVAQLTFSQNGKKVVWSAQAARNAPSTEIFAATMDGNAINTNSIARLTANDQYEAFPVLSPDGTEVAFERSLNQTNRHGYPSRIIIVPSDGRGPERPLVQHENFLEVKPASWAAWGGSSVSTSDTAGPKGTNGAPPTKAAAEIRKAPAPRAD